MASNGERGFTLVEILVVMLIIAILAAIAVPQFLNQRGKAQDADAKAVAYVVANAFEVYHQEHDSFSGATVADLQRIEESLSDVSGLAIDSTANTYTIEVTSASGNGPFTVERTSTDTIRTCGHPGDGGCPGSGEW